MYHSQDIGRAETVEGRSCKRPCREDDDGNNSNMMSAVAKEIVTTEIEYYPDSKFCTVQDEPDRRMRFVGLSTPANCESLSDTGASIRTLCSAIENLSKPIKLISSELVFEMGRFPCYHEDFEYTALSTASLDRCIAISHRWTDEINQHNALDVKWLKANWYKCKDIDNLCKPLFFYDYTSLPQKLKKPSLEREEQLTFKAGLELLDHLFSARSIVIPTRGYLFRYWCYVEFFIMEYHSSKLTGVPFVDPLPKDLFLMDRMLKIVHKAIVRPDAPELAQEIFSTMQWKVCSLGEKTAIENRGALMALLDMTTATRKAVLGSFLRDRENIVRMIRSRVRQCSLTMSEDEGYLKTVLAHYLDRPPVSFDELQGAEYVQWDGKAAGEGLAQKLLQQITAARADCGDDDVDHDLQYALMASTASSSSSFLAPSCTDKLTADGSPHQRKQQSDKKVSATPAAGGEAKVEASSDAEDEDENLRKAILLSFQS